MNIEFITAVQHWQDETTNYWFNVDGDVFAISDTNGHIRFIDCDGCPTDGNDRGVFGEILTKYPEYWKLAE